MIKGTPKTLYEAVVNASDVINELASEANLSHRLGSVDVLIIESNVRDFLAQRFGAALLNASEKPATKEELIVLWEKIIAA